MSDFILSRFTDALRAPRVRHPLSALPSRPLRGFARATYHPWD
jgi:hypothetical protein